MGTTGWVLADFVIAYAFILVAKTLGRQIPLLVIRSSTI